MSDQNDEQQDLFGDDEHHPIPFLNRLDVFAELKGGGGRLSIITAQPLLADRRTQERLLQKIECYLGFVNSEQFPTEHGAQTLENTEIKVVLKSGADPEIHDLLESCVDWAAEHNARLVWETDK